MKEKRLEDRPRLGSKPMLDAKQESLLIVLACSDAPEGRETWETWATWAMQLLADKLVELKVVEHISDETVRRTLKNKLKPWQEEQWCIPEVDAAFVWRMEDVRACA